MGCNIVVSNKNYAHLATGELQLQHFLQVCTSQLHLQSPWLSLLMISLRSSLDSQCSKIALAALGGTGWNGRDSMMPSWEIPQVFIVTCFHCHYRRGQKQWGCFQFDSNRHPIHGHRQNQPESKSSNSWFQKFQAFYMGELKAHITERLATSLVRGGGIQVWMQTRGSWWRIMDDYMILHIDIYHRPNRWPTSKPA